MAAARVWLFRSELPAATAGPGGGGGAITGTMPHRPGQDRVGATSSRSRLVATPARPGTPERQGDPRTPDAPPSSPQRSHTPAATMQLFVRRAGPQAGRTRPDGAGKGDVIRLSSATAGQLHKKMI